MGKANSMRSATTQLRIFLDAEMKRYTCSRKHFRACGSREYQAHRIVHAKWKVNTIVEYWKKKTENN